MRVQKLSTPTAAPAGFIATVDPAAARRQLHMSAGVVVVLAIAIALSAFAFRPEGQAVSTLDRHAGDIAALRVPTLPHPPMLVTRGG